MTHRAAPKSPYPDFVAQAWEEDALYHSDKQVYEAIIQDASGDTRSGEVLEYDTDAEAVAWSENYLKDKIGRIIELYRVPIVNETHVSSCDLWPDDVQHIARIEP
jgi:hypothetical protein